MNPPPSPNHLISVVMITYNHESFISQAIDSALSQTTISDTEILIFDDASTDRTQEIVKRYAESHPGKFRLNLRTRNVGMMTNFVEAWNCASGEYVALLEGDDFWTDATKLERQVLHLKSHPHHTGCAHDVRILDESGYSSVGAEDLHSQDLLEWPIESILRRNPFGTCSMIYRRTTVGQLPPWFRQLPIADWPLHMLHACRGPIGRIPFEMGTYRIHGASSWSSTSLERRTLATLGMLRQMRSHLLAEHVPYLDTTIRCMALYLAARSRSSISPPLIGPGIEELFSISKSLRQQLFQLYAFILCTRYPVLHRILRIRDRLTKRGVEASESP